MKAMVYGAIRTLQLQILKLKERKALAKGGEAFFDLKIAEVEFRLARVQSRFLGVAYQRQALKNLYSSAS